MNLGDKVSTPIMSAGGELGTLTLACNWDENGGNGQITYQTDKGTRLILYFRPDVNPGQHIWTLSEFGNPDTVTIPWSGTPINDIWFDAMIERNIRMQFLRLDGRHLEVVAAAVTAPLRSASSLGLCLRRQCVTLASGEP